MAKECQIHESHPHQHGPGCGHTAIQHEGHTDYLHDGHMHHLHEGHVDEHRITIDSKNPDARTPGDGHDKAHQHGSGCGHEAVPHGDHTDYLVNGHLHHQEDGQCYDHGAVDAKAA